MLFVVWLWRLFVCLSTEVVYLFGLFFLIHLLSLILYSINRRIFSYEENKFYRMLYLTRYQQINVWKKIILLFVLFQYTVYQV